MPSEQDPNPIDPSTTPPAQPGQTPETVANPDPLAQPPPAQPGQTPETNATGDTSG